MKAFSEQIALKKNQFAQEEMIRQEQTELSRIRVEDFASSGRKDYYAMAEELFTDNYEHLLIGWGFTNVSKGKWVSPHSGSGKPGFNIKPSGIWFSHHGSDKEAGLGKSKDGDSDSFGDICDLLYFFENDNVEDIVFLADFLTGTTDNQRKQEYAEKKSLDEALDEFNLPVVLEGIVANDDNQVLKPNKNKPVFTLIDSTQLTARKRSNDWLVKGVLECNNFGMIFGEPASGKSLIAIDMAYCISKGSSWNGHVTRQGNVVYVAGEGFTGLSRRVRALDITYKTTAENLFFSEMPTSLTDTDSVKAVAEAILAFCPEPVLVVIDTLHRNFGTGDENSAGDFGTATNHIDKYFRSTGAAVLLVHHSGHSSRDRSRGSSSIKAALDVEYSIVKNDRSQVSMTCTKSKDFDEPEPENFKIVEVELGWTDEDGDEITSVTVEPYNGYMSMGRKRDLSAQNKEILEMLTRAINSHGVQPTSELTAEFSFDVDELVVKTEHWREKVYPILSQDNNDAKRQAFKRGTNKLKELRKVQMYDDYWWLGHKEQLSSLIFAVHKDG